MLSRTLRPRETKYRDLTFKRSQDNAWRAGAVVESVTGKRLEPYRPPSLNQVADAYSKLKRQQREAETWKA